MASATDVNRSGNRANGPKPNARKPKAQVTNGLEARAYHHWIRGIEHRASPFSLSEIEKLEWSCGR